MDKNNIFKRYPQSGNTNNKVASSHNYPKNWATNQQYISDKNYQHSYENIPVNQPSFQDKSKKNMSMKIHPSHSHQCKNCQKLTNQLQQCHKNQQQLSQSILQINQCYKEKTQILEATIRKYSLRCEQLLQWKQAYIDRQMENNEKYQEQNTKLLDTLENVLKEYEQEKQCREELEAKVIELQNKEAQKQLELKENEQEVERILGERMKEIEELKAELAMLNTQLQHSQIHSRYNNDQQKINEDEKQEQKIENETAEYKSSQLQKVEQEGENIIVNDDNKSQQVEKNQSKLEENPIKVQAQLLAEEESGPVLKQITNNQPMLNTGQQLSETKNANLRPIFDQIQFV